MADSKSTNRGYVYGIAASVTFSAYLLINRYVYVNYDVNTTSYVLTFIMAAGFFAVVSLLRGWLAGQFRAIGTKTVGFSVVNGILSTIGIGLIVFAQSYTTAINASIIATSTVLLTVVFSWLILKEVLVKFQVFGLGLFFVGLYLAIVGFHAIHLNKGDIIILLTAVLFGFTNVFAKVLMRHASSSFVADVRIASGGIFAFCLGLVWLRGDFVVMNAGVLPFLAGFLFWVTIKLFYSAVFYVNPSRAIVLANIHPAFTPLVGVLVLGESYTLATFIGSALIILSIYMITVPSAQIKLLGKLRRVPLE